MVSDSTLLNNIRHCEICKAALPYPPKPVLQFDPQAKILIAGQTPGIQAHESGMPFNDASGDRLRAWLGLSRDMFYDASAIAILPMGFCYPGKGANGDLPPRAECAIAWREALLEQLTQLELTLVIGRYAHDYHFGKDGLSLTERVKNWQAYWPQQVPLPHPSPRNVRWFINNPWFEENMLPALQKRVAELVFDQDCS
ncbi:uracil-DNA glycosylase family protein [Thiomicrorhabdus sp. zzn3]|uniref:uracil-DNA glycosylase family protein n=1 Tax=Thiomicrorhabdus sp. zzn3 TaxID=3039775 RepID=UPI0024374155|nr:uracil-DNA glycosylase family protein [Thiomicrorhabdus sp. zzn3]MDG6778123.1 uracil-DNA glycosylase family protein [Thiomicrorhabdus sp. zzn3]